jgi:hypothetical protein
MKINIILNYELYGNHIIQQCAYGGKSIIKFETKYLDLQLFEK